MPRAEKIRIASGVAHREVEGRMLVLGPGDHALLALNATGAFLWHRLERGNTADGLARALARRYRVPMVRARQDVDAFLVVLARRQLVVKI